MTKLFGFFSKENSVRGASLILIITLTLSNLLGLVRDRFLTKNIETFNLDVYYASFRIPDLIFNFLILGAISSAFIPIFSEFIAKDDKKKVNEGHRIASSLINIAVSIMIVVAIGIFFLMPYLVPIVVPKFDSSRMAETVKFSRLLMLTPIFFSFSYIVGGILNSYKRFLAYSLAPLFYNLSIIIGAYFFAPRYGLTAVVWSVVAGAFIHLLIQLPSAIKIGYRHSWVFDWKNSSIRRIVKLMIPRTIGMGTNQIMLLFYTAIASTLAAGSITSFELGNNIQTMPSVVFGTSFATAVFPTLTAKIALNDNNGFAFYLNRAMRSIAFLLIPATVVFILLRAQIIRLILGSGKFGWEDTRRTALVLGFFSLSLLAQGLIPLLARAFYSLKNTKTPMYISIVSALTSVAFGYPLAKSFGVAGLAFAFSIGSFANAAILYYFLNKRYSSVLNKNLFKSIAYISLISIAMGISMWTAMHISANFVDMSRFIGVLTQTVITLVVGGFVYFGLSYLFECEEMKWALTRKINGNEAK